ncbi:hypothetical protein [Cohnella sp.]
MIGSKSRTGKAFGMSWKKTEGMTVIGEASNGEEAVSQECR